MRETISSKGYILLDITTCKANWGDTSTPQFFIQSRPACDRHSLKWVMHNLYNLINKKVFYTKKCYFWIRIWTFFLVKIPPFSMTIQGFVTFFAPPSQIEEEEKNGSKGKYGEQHALFYLSNWWNSASWKKVCENCALDRAIQKNGSNKFTIKC